MRTPALVGAPGVCQGAPVRALLRRLGLALGLWALLVALPEWPWLRTWLAWPLDVHTVDPRGEVAYVLGSGSLSIGERLHAAADLWHEKRVRRILLPADGRLGRFDFNVGRSRTVDEWSRAELEWLGVPADAVERVEVADAWLDTAAEAEAVRGAMASKVHRLVLVSSPVHLRRARLAFERVLGPQFQIETHAASALPDGPDFHRPLWLEYLKLLVYAVAL